MENTYLIIMAILFIMNTIGFYFMWADKQRAIKKQRRIKESTLWQVAIFGGAVGVTLGMNTFRHKTKHVQFKYGLPVLSILEVGIILYFISNLS